MLFKRAIRVEVYDSRGVGRVLSDPLHISFTVELAKGSKPDEGEIRIYNLSPTTRESLRNESTGVRLYAGYGDTPPPKIFEGAVISAKSNPDGNTDFLTTIRAADGFSELDGVYYSRTFPGGTTFAAIVADVVASLGFPLDINPAAVPGTVLRGRTFDGKAKSILNALAREVGFEWSVRYGVAVVGLPGAVDRSNPGAITLAPESGLVGTPTVKYERNGGDGLRRRITATTLLLPGLRQGRLVSIKSGRFIEEETQGRGKTAGDITAEGIYVLDKLTLTGDNYGGEFTAEVSGYANR